MTTKTELEAGPSSPRRRPVLRHSNNFEPPPQLEAKPSSPRRVLLHSNHLKCGSFMEETNKNEKENTRRRLRPCKSANDEESLRRRFGLHPGAFASDEQPMSILVKDKDEWGRFHQALRRKRKRGGASIQQCINRLVEEQQQQQQQQRTAEEQAVVTATAEAPSNEGLPLGDPQRLSGLYCNALVSSS